MVLESPQNAEEGSIYYEQFCVRDTPFKLGKQSHYLLLGNLASSGFLSIVILGMCMSEKELLAWNLKCCVFFNYNVNNRRRDWIKTLLEVL